MWDSKVVEFNKVGCGVFFLECRGPAGSRTEQWHLDTVHTDQPLRSPRGDEVLRAPDLQGSYLDWSHASDSETYG